MAIDLSTYHIVSGDDTELVTKLNDMMDGVQAGVNGGLSDIDDNLDTLSAQITEELDDAVDVVEAAGETAVTAAATATTQAGIATTGANNASNSADAAAASAGTAAEIVNISEVQEFTNLLARTPRVAMTRGTSSTSGIKTPNDVNSQPGIGDFGVTIIAKTDDFFESADFDGWAVGSREDGDNRWVLGNTDDGKVRAFANVGATTIFDVEFDVSSSIGVNKTDGDFIVLSFFIKRETSTSDGVFKAILNGTNIGSTAITAASTVDISNTGDFEWMGYNGDRLECEWIETIFHNRFYSDDEALALHKTGPSPADIGAPWNRASQAAAYESDFSSGTSGFSGTGGTASFGVTGPDSESDWLEFEFSGSSGYLLKSGNPYSENDPEASHWVEMEIYVDPTCSATRDLMVSTTTSLALSKSPQFIDGYPGNLFGNFRTLVPGETITVMARTEIPSNYSSAFGFASSGGDAGDIILIKFVKYHRAGITALWSAEHAQSDTGQVLDQIHTSHGLLPSSGATRIPQNYRPVIESPSAHSWTATDEMQYVAGNQALMSGDDSFLVIDVDTDTSFDLNVGDGNDADRFVAAHTLSVGKNRLTIANPFNDGTNRKLTVKPASSVTAEITVHAQLIKERI